MTSPAAPATRSTRHTTITLPARHDVQLTVDDTAGSGGTFLLLHGGGGPRTMGGFAELLAEHSRGRVLLPTHPGFAGTPVAESLTSTRELASAYVGLVEHLDLADVTLVGNSFGGWLAAEIALLGNPRIGRVVIVDGIGLAVPGHAPADVRGLTPAQLAALSFHDPSKAPTPPSAGGTGPSPDVLALLRYSGPDMVDATLAGRLADLDVPAQIVWGESDGIVDAEYGAAYADAIPNATFTLLHGTGHLPQLETPGALLDVILDGAPGHRP